MGKNNTNSTKKIDVYDTESGRQIGLFSTTTGELFHVDGLKEEIIDSIRNATNLNNNNNECLIEEEG